MGAWDSDPFGNDSACDWIYQLETVNDLSLIENTLKAVIEVGGEYLESFEAEQAVAAVDTIARLKGNFYVKNPSTETLDKWVESNNFEINSELIDLSVKVLDRIQTAPSELLELWEESDEFSNWKKHLEDLKIRISS